ncbi:MAG: Gfo/Idh/MocA family protein [Candidatus Limnocylindria bacterium]
MSSRPITLVVIGAGNRGRDTYGRWCLAHPDAARVVAVAERDSARLTAMADEHGLGAEAAFADWRALLARQRMADAIVVATPDREHAAPTIAALDAGYDVILEKPIAPTPEEVRAVGETAARTGGSVTVAHVLRHTAFFSTLKDLLDEGRIGELVTIEHAERIGYWHFAHSFVRGNWRNEALASPMILAKACHDLDLVRWLAGDRCTTVASFGGLHHFRPEQAPEGALDRCTDGVRRCPAAPQCPFDAVRLYVERTREVTGWPISVITDDPSPAGRLQALASGPYGRCVYRCDNDVADHQVVALEFANGVRASLTVTGLTADNTRRITLSGTRGELRGRLDTGEIELRHFLPAPDAPSASPWDRDALGRSAMRDDERVVLNATPVPLYDGHGGGDDGFLTDAIARLAARRDGGTEQARDARTSLAVSIDSHVMAFAAEESRHQRRMVELR